MFDIFGKKKFRKKKNQNLVAEPILSAGQIHTVVNLTFSLLGDYGSLLQGVPSNFACDSLKWYSVRQINAESLSQSCSEHSRITFLYTVKQLRLDSLNTN